MPVRVVRGRVRVRARVRVRMSVGVVQSPIDSRHSLEAPVARGLAPPRREPLVQEHLLGRRWSRAGSEVVVPVAYNEQWEEHWGSAQVQPLLSDGECLLKGDSRPRTPTASRMTAMLSTA